jgi:hypothetical protein
MGKTTGFQAFLALLMVRLTKFTPSVTLQVVGDQLQGLGCPLIDLTLIFDDLAPI